MLVGARPKYSSLLVLTLLVAFSSHRAAGADTPPMPTSEVSNGSFEEGLTNWTPFIPGDSKDKNCRFTISHDSPHTGASCGLMQADSFARFGLSPTNISIQSGGRYRIGVWLRGGPDLQFQAGTAGIIVRLSFYQKRRNSSAGPLFLTLNNELTREGPATDLSLIPKQWIHIEGVVDTPADADAIGPVLFFWYAKGSLYVDDLTIEKVDASVPLTPFAPPKLPPLTKAQALLASLNPSQEQAFLDSLALSKEKELFDALDLSQPALATVQKAVAQGDLATAQHELANYYRQRTDPSWKFDPTPNPPTKDPVAEDAVNGTVQGGLVPPKHTFSDDKIDWFYNETFVIPGVAHNVEWQWQLCRMSFWANLGNAYHATKDERYAKAWIAQFHTFMIECPPPANANGGNRGGSAWRTIDSGIRMTSFWPVAFFSFLSSPQFTDEDIMLYLDSSLEHARYLRKNNTNGNWLTFEMSGLYTIGAYFPEFKESKDWRDYAATRMHDQETAQFLPDGAQNELSTMYHNAALDNFVSIARVAANAGRLQELPQGYAAGLQNAFDFDLHIMAPDGFFPMFNDAKPYRLAYQFNNALQFFPDNPYSQWAASDGKKGKPPEETSHAFPWAGYYVMRSRWEKDANYLVLRAGPLGLRHAHQDKLNVVLWAFGKQILFNSGGADYETSKWRDYSISSFSKNTVLVDGKPQMRDFKNLDSVISKAPIDARWESTPDHDFATGIYNEGYGSLTTRLATHTRRVLFVKPDLFIVADTLVPNDANEHTYQARWNLLTTNVQQDSATQAVTTIDKNQPNLAIVPLLTTGLDVRSASAQSQPELLGWYIQAGRSPEYYPATTVLHTLHGSGVQNFLTLLVPIQAGKSFPIQSVKPAAGDSATVTFNDGRILSIVTDPDPKGGIEVTETLANGGIGRHVKVPVATAATAASP
jgi:hypothetical protein